jgi:hypothetical protein
MNQELVITWTPILKELSDDQRERARQLIEKYGETNPTNFIVELLEVFGIHAAYLQTVPAQVRIAGERAKADVRQSIDAVTTLHERTRLELNEIVSAVSRTGAGFAKALETATTTQVRAAESTARELKATIAQEFAKQNLPALSNCLKEIETKAAESLRQAKRIHEDAEQYESYAKERLASSEERCRASLDKVESINWRGAWIVCILSSLALLVCAGFFMYSHLRSRSDQILADQIARTAATIQDNKDAFMELCAADLRVKVQETTSSQTDIGAPRQFVILVEGALGAEMRDYRGGKAGCIFVHGPSLEEEFTRLRVATEEAAKRLGLMVTNATTTH